MLCPGVNEFVVSERVEEVGYFSFCFLGLKSVGQDLTSSVTVCLMFYFGGSRKLIILFE